MVGPPRKSKRTDTPLPCMTPLRAVEGWMKLAAMCRAAGDVDAAREAVSGALRADPYDFVARLLRASLLERAGFGARAREAYGEALAQRPDPIPPHLAATVAHAEAQYALFVADTQQRLADATAAIGEQATPAAAARIARFRTKDRKSQRLNSSN